MRRRRLSLALVLIVTASSARAAAETPPPPDPQALAHFQRGKQLRDDGNCKDAIPELRASVQIQDSIGGWYNLGFCHERLGDNGEAYRAFRKAGELAKRWNDDRLREIAAARESVLDRSPHVKLAITPQPLPEGTEIAVDGVAVLQDDYSTEIVVFPRTPGRQHVVVVHAPGYREASGTVENGKLLVVALQKPGDVPPPPVSPQRPGWTWQHWTGLGLLGAGLVVVGIGGYFIVKHQSDLTDVETRLNDHPCRAEDPTTKQRDLTCTDSEVKNAKGDYAGKSPNELQASLDGLVSENNDLVTSFKVKAATTFVIGGLLLVGGTVLFLTAKTVGPAPASPTPGDQARFRLVPEIGARTQALHFVATF